jgi:DNA primase
VVALVHQHQREVKTMRHGARETKYVEVMLEDIALANELAHEALGRTLDELPPQTRRLLGLLVEMVDAHCTAHQIGRAQHRFSRRAVREHTRWGDTQLKVHLARLVELEYLLVHRGGRGQSFEYELVFDGEANTDARHASGLIDVEALKHAYDAQRSGSDEVQSGPGRGTAGTLSAAGRAASDAGNAEECSTSGTSSPANGQHAPLRPRKRAASHVVTR